MERATGWPQYLLIGRLQNLFKIDHVRRPLSALGQKQTFAMHQPMSPESDTHSDTHKESPTHRRFTSEWLPI
jgi:hypothetical protein